MEFKQASKLGVDVGENLDIYLDRKNIERLAEGVKALSGKLRDLSDYKVIMITTVFTDPLTEGIVKLHARAINNLGRQYIIKGSLAKCLQVKLDDGTTQLLSYIAFSPQDADKIQPGE